MKTYTRRDNLVMGLGMALTACGGSSSSSSTGLPIGGAPTPTPTTPTPTPTTPTPTTPTPTPTTTTTIKSAAAAKNMRFGSTFAYNSTNTDSDSFQNPSYAALLETDCQLLVPENELKMPQLRPTEAAFNFGPADAMLAYAESKGMAMRGHNLLWYRPDSYILPGWVINDPVLKGSDAAAARARAEQIVRDHINGVADHYGTRITSWDVVNEAVDPGTGNIRGNALATAVNGDTSLLDLAFTTARAKMPTAELVYNDYMDGGTPQHRAGVLSLLQGFRDRHVPVDTLGVQSHIGFYGLNGSDPIGSAINYNISNMKTFLDQVVALGYKLKVTEMDVNDVNVPGTVTDRDAATARFARAWLDLILSYGASVSDVLFWGMSDKYSWLQSSSFGTRTDGQPKRPDPYDANFQPKPMRQSIIDAFQATTSR